MNQILKSKLQSWSAESMHAAHNFMPVVPQLEEEDNTFWVNDDLGFYVISHNYAYYFNNDTKQSLSESNDLDSPFNDFAVLSLLFTESQQQSFSFAEPVEVETSQNYEQISYSMPSLGVPFAVKYFSEYETIDEPYVTEYIDQVAWIIKTLKDSNSMFPETMIFPDHRYVCNDRVYFFGPLKFILTYDQFIVLMLDNFKVVLNKIFSHLDTTNLYSQAETKWKM